MKRDMRKYILRKLVELIFTLLFVTLLSFLLMRLSSVDPATAYAKRMIGNPTAEQIEKIRIQLGFDKPLLVQYGRWVWDLLHFDLGVSLANGHDVWTDIATAFPKTLGIVALASIFQVVFIVIVSCIAFLLPWKLPKKAVRLLCILGLSIPNRLSGLFCCSKVLNFCGRKYNPTQLHISGNLHWRIRGFFLYAASDGCSGA